MNCTDSEEDASANIIGLTASALYVVSLSPQLYMLLQGKYDTSGISATMFVTQLVSGIMWLAYGILDDNLPVWIFGIISTLMRVSILICLVRDRCIKKKVLVSIPPTHPSAAVTVMKRGSGIL